MENPAYKDLPMTYAGRLDPMAEGLLLVLVGEECKKKEDYLYLSKEYEVEVLFGFETDTSDILGKVTKTVNYPESLTPEKILEALEKVKILPQRYPAYSSKTFEGKPLWKWAREGNIKEVGSNAKITGIEFLGQREIYGGDLLESIEERVLKVNGDFRQKDILDLWKEQIDLTDNYKILRFRIYSTGGAYMRVVAKYLGDALDIPSLAFSIKREKIGDYKY
ncbi:MAG: hypothetical protein WCO18_01925 [bacterium]